MKFRNTLLIVGPQIQLDPTFIFPSQVVNFSMKLLKRVLVLQLQELNISLERQNAGIHVAVC